MPPEIYSVAIDLPGRLFIMPCPRAACLSRDIEFYRQQGVDTILSLLAENEAGFLKLDNEAAACADAGIDFLSSPITDFGLPDIDVFDPLVHKIADKLRDGHHVAAHCRAGIGRTGMLTAATLIALRDEAEDAVQKVAVARGVPIPDTVEQGNFIFDFGLRNRQAFH